MVTGPKVLGVDVVVGEVRRQFQDDHVVMVLLADEGSLRGALLREDVPDAAPASSPALPWSTVVGRTVRPTDSAAAVHRRLVERGERRLAVVDDAGRLVGLVCLKRSRTGFCSDAGVRARAAARLPG
ncbi:CBS domain-containing protein [Blastococcus sp. TF02-8]|uniref:CBS domain-containing protein n=1 Tax=Blastococcus sp. TF02-8 TaxID=2250574 RepID=UPI00210159AE|nr:CBS domain-containing protein [Blastococcus sp. TF02-8]